MNFLDSLNPPQREAVISTTGPLLILAGAGSGKTRVITYRIAYMIGEEGVPPYQILAVTFTNKAAGEMRERVFKALAGTQLSSAPLISTFHALCVRILRQNIEELGAGYTKSFTIYDQDDSLRLIKACIKECGYDDKQVAPRATQSAISAAKNGGQDAELYAARIENHDEKRAAIARVYKTYEAKLAANNALDFDDLLIKTVSLLRQSQKVRDYYNDKFRYILVDEYQDTNALQFALIRYLTQKQQNICVVGDENQCVTADTLIQTERGAIKAEEIRFGDMVLSAKGDDNLQYSRVTDVFCRPVINQPVVTIKTKRGQQVTTTPEHIHFARFAIEGPEYFFTYLMYKEGMGYRLGVTRRYRCGGASGKTLGFIQRLNQERGDAVWLLESCQTESEARYWEQYYAAKFGLPTCVFNFVEGMALSQVDVSRLFAALDTESGAKKLMAHKNMLFDYPHHVPKCTTLRRRRNFSVTLCKDGRHGALHYCEVYGSDMEDAKKLEDSGLYPTPSNKTKGWRVRIATQDFERIAELHQTMKDALGSVNLICKAGFASGTSLHFTPASHVQPGMMVYVQTKKGIAKDDVVSVKQSLYTGNVYDFNVERTHNFVAGGIFTHNSVYRFRGADIQNILNFEEQYKAAKVIRLEQNYRSTQNILDAAGAVIKNNTERRDKKLWTANNEGDKIRYFQARDADEEARFVAQKIVEHKRYDHKVRAAVLYRTNSQSRVFEEALRRAMIPYNIVGGFSFYERAEVKDIISYLKLALNPDDSIALMRVVNSPTRGIGKTTLDELERRARDYGVSHWETIKEICASPDGMMPRAVAALQKFQEIIARLIKTAEDSVNATEDRVSGVVKAAIEQTGYAAALNAEATDEAEARLANLEELVNAAVDFDRDEELTLRDFIDHAALVSDTDSLKSDSLVTLMTIHAAKGLEFPLVFVVGMEDGLLPHARAARDPRDLEEERRLCYVAITRAEQHLYVSHAMTRRVYGEEMQAEPSQFLNELPLDLLDDLSRGASWLSFARKSQGNRDAARALSGEKQYEKKAYTGQTYDSVDAIADFFRKRGQNIELPADRPAYRQPEPPAKPTAPAPKIVRREDRLPPSTATPAPVGSFLPGAQVRHPKYGRGLVLRREGSGDNVKLTVNFPGYGPKKLIEKYAGLEKA